MEYSLLDFVKGYFKPTFITIHYLYIALCIVISSIMIYPGQNISYINAILLSSGACTQGGLDPYVKFQN